MNWENILNVIIKHVPNGSITTYGNLSEYCFNHRKGGQSIRAMLQAAVDDDFNNSIHTNRVIYSNGKIADVNGQLGQLINEGQIIKKDKINVKNTPLIVFKI
ncbi:MGMT family protein [Aliivibrio fischeri]|uniref:MGMT family protein n=1 Tax=Aliivibrio fischeri TaxID=668 RepID=UPI00080D9C2C|nr:MGMT family protein [Aliivibrio fischeri]OCH08380.1 hypothetical protein A6E10_19370 [Aliivibrio fischeri]